MVHYISVNITGGVIHSEMCTLTLINVSIMNKKGNIGVSWTRNTTDGEKCKSFCSEISNTSSGNVSGIKMKNKVR